MYSNNLAITGDPNIKPETIDTYELGYIYRDPKTAARLTLFQSKMRDVIAMNFALRSFVNTPGYDLQGAELELEKTLSAKLKIDGNISHVDTENRTTGRDAVFVSSWLGNAGILYQPAPDYVLAGHYRYVGKRTRDPSDRRSELGADETVDVTGSIFNLWQKGVTFRTGVLNLFDEKVMDPSGEYPQDLPRPGRHFWMKLSYDF